ncbi:MAG: DUF615 domain-containing protein [Burkholderiaceae bacterium]|nr:DUF615 domain-containing protein [Burkholderiaceae bacterium]
MKPTLLDTPRQAGDLDRPSKTRRKQDAHQQQALGQALAALPDERLSALALPEELVLAIRDLKRTRSREGKRRQMQFIGKLMRRIDPVPIREALASKASAPGATSTR